MIIKILEQNGSVSTTIPLCDIDHIETRTLNFFGEKAHNLYLVLRKGEDLYFHLLTYLSQYNRDLAEKQLSSLILSGQKNIAADDDVFELVPSAAPMHGGEAQLIL